MKGFFKYMNLRGIIRFTRVKPVSHYRRIIFFFSKFDHFFWKTLEKRFDAGKPVYAAF